MAQGTQSRWFEGFLMSGLFSTPRIPKAQPTVTPQDAAITSMDEALRLRKRKGRQFNMLFGGRRRGQLGSAAGMLGTSGGGTGSAPGGGGSGGGGGGFDAGGGGGGGGGGLPF
jgi:hypothetical protein